MHKFLGAFLALGLAHSVPAAEIPRPAPEYTLTMPGGQQLNLSQLKGKVVMIEFLLTTCPHCQKTSAMLSKLLNEYGPKGVTAFGVAVDEKANIADFKGRYGVTFPVGKAPRDSVYAFLQHSFMAPSMMFPQLVFVDRAGNIRGQYSGIDAFFQNEEKNVREMLDKLLSEGGAKQPSTRASKKKVS